MITTIKLKKNILLSSLLFLLFFSCTLETENILLEDEKSETENTIDKKETLKSKILNNNKDTTFANKKRKGGGLLEVGNPTESTYDYFSEDVIKLDLYTYVIGRVILKHSVARGSILSSLDSNDNVSLNSLLINHDDIRDAFILELNYFSDNDFGYNVMNRIATYRIRPPLTTYTEDLENLDTIILAKNEILNEISHHTFINQYELYIPFGIVFEHDTSGSFIGGDDGNAYFEDEIYTGFPSVLNGSTTFSNGYSLYSLVEDNGGVSYDRGSNITYNTVISHDNNVITVTPDF